MSEVIEYPCKQCGLERSKPDADMTLGELIDLRALLSVAIWTRSEQLAKPETLIRLHEKDMPPVLLDTHDIATSLCRAQMNRAQQLWKKLTEILGSDISKASWE